MDTESRIPAVRHWRLCFALWLTLAILESLSISHAQPQPSPLLKRPWFEARTTHFAIFSCAPTQQVARVGARLEQFREAYSSLAGAQSVASQPIVVMVFPDHTSMEPFLPVYQDKPANLAAFFHRDSDENLIALYVSGTNSGSLQNVFHEYTHLLLRHNAPFWPLWLNEGMADIYSTFEPAPDRTARIGAPLPMYLRILSRRPLVPLSDLFAVGHESPDYNERDRQGIFYAESWLLTHYLMLGDNARNKAHFGQLTTLLKQGQSPVQAFTNAFHVTLTQMENQLRGYLEHGRFDSLKLAVNSDLSAPRAFSTFPLPTVAVCFRLGDMLMRVNRPDAAVNYFELAKKLAPRSPLPYEGLGLLASDKKQSVDAVRELQQALSLGSTSFLAHYTFAREKYRLTAKAADTYTPVSREVAAEIRGELDKAIQLMPGFAPAHHMLGFFLMVQGENLPEAEKQIQIAMQLEPDNPGYLFSLAQAQLRRDNPSAALKTLEPLRLSYLDAQIRQHADEMIKEIQKETRSH
jgi:tetratricopeptide (TPR) repeat protein